MPQYKRKRVNRFKQIGKHKSRKHVLKNETDDIKMTPSAKTGKPRKNDIGDAMRVVKGKKLERKRNMRIFITAIAVLALGFSLLHFMLPSGIAESAGNLVAAMGAGSYPAELEGSDTLNTVTNGMYYYVLSDTSVSAFSNNGKNIYTHLHGYENPVLKVSETRALVYSLGQTDAVIYTLNSQKSSIKTEKEILCAAISDSGVYAFATRSDSYASVVSVYSKKDELIYEWYSSEDTVTGIVISSNGKKIAVSCLNASSGNFSSKICVLNFNSATPELNENFGETVVYALEAFSSRGFIAVTANQVIFFSWKDCKKTEYTDEYNISMLRSGSGGYAAVFNRVSDKSDNHIAFFGTDGRLKYEFAYKGVISDIAVYRGHIYCIGDTACYLLSNSGEMLKGADCGFGCRRIAAVGTDRVVFMTDNKAEQITLEDMKK